MAMTPVYLVANKNLSKFLDSIRHAQAPDKITLRFVEELGFTSTNDRLFVPLLRALRFIDEAGKPTARYHEFLDDTQWKVILADGIRDAYPDLFRVNRNANTLSRESLVGKIKSLCEGKPSEAVVQNTARTFTELVKLADFSAESKAEKRETDDDSSVTDEQEIADFVSTKERAETNATSSGTHPTLVYRIEIILPAVRDQAIYDAIFKSVKQHLLR